MSKNRARDRAARAHMNASGAYRARAARTVDTSGAEPTVATTAFLLCSAIPAEPSPGLQPDATMESLFGALVARSAHEVQRDGQRYPTFFNVYVVPPPATAQPNDAPEGWRLLDAFILVTARRPWHLEDEDQRVITDAFRAARAALNDYWPGLPDWADHAALPLWMLAGLRGMTTDDEARGIVTEMQRAALEHTWTIGADSDIDPRW
ncbi:hypothetical protein ACFC0S_15890 [Streptomyces sp. NPDC056084]|uniref:hypothetical protein n=1 Tax=unclassified Streptomyces TaxID=2593676 RepID=UPI0035E2EF9F